MGRICLFYLGEKIMNSKRKRKHKPRLYEICSVCHMEIYPYSEPFFPKVEGRLHHDSTIKASIGESWFRRYRCVTCNRVQCYRVQKTASRPYPMFPVTVREFFETVGMPSSCLERNLTAFKVLFGVSYTEESIS